MAGSYSLEEVEPYSFYGAGPWIWIREDERLGCTALVATSGFSGQRYAVELSNELVQLTPVTAPAQGGSEGTLEPEGYELTEWSEITLGLVGAALAGTASANVKWSYDEEDVWDVGERTIELSLREAAPATTAIAANVGPWDNADTVVKGEVIASTEASVLPWAAAKVMVSRPTAGIADQLVLPPGWEAVDVEEEHGVREALVSFTGAWGEIQGNEAAVALDGLVDLSGMPVPSSAMSIRVIDAGTPQPTHDMSSTDTIVSLGTPIEAYLAGACADTGCVKLNAFCGDRATVLGQILLDGDDEIAVRMWKDTSVEYPEDPAFYRVELVAEDGTRLTPTSGGTWNGENPEQLWLYDASGHAKVGFSTSTTNYCHGWGGALILDDVAAR